MTTVEKLKSIGLVGDWILASINDPEHWRPEWGVPHPEDAVGLFTEEQLEEAARELVEVFSELRRTAKVGDRFELSTMDDDLDALIGDHRVIKVHFNGVAAEGGSPILYALVETIPESRWHHEMG